MTWTATPPSAPGWYWVRHEKMPPVVVHVRWEGAKLFASNPDQRIMGNPDSLRDHALSRGLFLHWAGPILPPEAAA